jgi:hypothetical protein
MDLWEKVPGDFSPGSEMSTNGSMYSCTPGQIIDQTGFSSASVEAASSG